MNNPYDCDGARVHQEQNVQISPNVEVEEQTDIDEIILLNEDNNLLVTNPLLCEDIIESTHITTNSSSSNAKWSKQTPALLQTPKSTVLNNAKTANSSNEIKKWSKRRRPAPAVIPRNELTDLYKQVALEKLAYYKAQNEEIELKRKRDLEEYQKTVEREEEEFHLKKKILLLDIQIKEQQLTALSSLSN